MSTNYEKLFNKIMTRIGEEQRRSAVKQRIAVFSLGLAVSATAFVPTLHMVQKGLVESGFLNFISLIFSDLGAVLANWQNFLFAILESFPVMSVIAFLAVLFVFLQSLKFLSRDAKVILAAVNTH